MTTTTTPSNRYSKKVTLYAIHEGEVIATRTTTHKYKFVQAAKVDGSWRIISWHESEKNAKNLEINWLGSKRVLVPVSETMEPQEEPTKAPSTPIEAQEDYIQITEHWTSIPGGGYSLHKNVNFKLVEIAPKGSGTRYEELLQEAEAKSLQGHKGMTLNKLRSWGWYEPSPPQTLATKHFFEYEKSLAHFHEAYLVANDWLETMLALETKYNHRPHRIQNAIKGVEEAANNMVDFIQRMNEITQ